MVATTSDPDPGRPPRGLVCASCAGRSWRVVYTRGRDGGVIQRLRTCRTCGEKIVTWESRVPSESRRSRSA